MDGPFERPLDRPECCVRALRGAGARVRCVGRSGDEAMTPRTAFNVFTDLQFQRIKALPIHQARVLIAPPIKRPIPVRTQQQLAGQTGPLTRTVPPHRRGMAIWRQWQTDRQMKFWNA